MPFCFLIMDDSHYGWYFGETDVSILMSHDCIWVTVCEVEKNSNKGVCLAFCSTEEIKSYWKTLSYYGSHFPTNWAEEFATITYTFREFSRLKFASLDTINVFVPLKFTNFSIAKIRNFTVYVRNIFVSTTRYLCEETTCFYVQARTQTQCRNYSGTCQNRFLHISLPLG